MIGRVFDVSKIEDIADGLLIRITPVKSKQTMSSPDRFSENTNYIPTLSNNNHIRQVTLSAAEEEEISYYGYKSNLPIHIPGDTEKRVTNIVLVDRVKVFIGDVPLALFLRLVVELFKNKRGIISRSKLINTGFIKAGSEFQSVGRLRQGFRVALGNVSPEEFIETCEHKSIRLSIHPSLISYDREKLLHHRNEKIRRLARRLP